MPGLGADGNDTGKAAAMCFLDSRTLLFVSGLIDALLTVILLCSCRVNKVYPGYALWTAGYVAKVAGSCLLLAGIARHSVVLLLAANILIVMSTDLLYRGIRRFTRVEARVPVGQYLLYVSALAGYCYVLFVRNDAGLRIIISSICFAVLAFEIAQVVWRNLGEDYRADRMLMSAIAGSTALVFCVRAVLTFLTRPNPELGLDILTYPSWIFPYAFCMSIGMTILFLDCNVRRLILENRAAHSELKVLQGLLPICSYCKKIRDGGNNWLQMETYIARHSEADFTHGVCPECFNSAMQLLNKTAVQAGVSQK
jgi:hypothetical protein